MPAIAVTDHGNTFAAFEFYKTAKDAGIKPIIGIEAYVTPGHAPLRQGARAVGHTRSSPTTTSRARARTRT